MFIQVPVGSGSDNSLVVTLNDIVYDAEKNWSDLSSIAKTKYGVDFAVLDINNNVRYDSLGEGSGERTYETYVYRTDSGYMYVNVTSTTVSL